MDTYTYVKLGLVALVALVFVGELARWMSRGPASTSRYAITGTRSVAYILDRVTGEVTCCNPQQCWDLEISLYPFDTKPSRSPRSEPEEPTALEMILGE